MFRRVRSTGPFGGQEVPSSPKIENQGGRVTIDEILEARRRHHEWPGDLRGWSPRPPGCPHPSNKIIRKGGFRQASPLDPHPDAGLHVVTPRPTRAERGVSDGQPVFTVVGGSAACAPAGPCGKLIPPGGTTAMGEHRGGGKHSLTGGGF